MVGEVRRTTAGAWEVECEPHVMLRLKRVFGKVSKTSKGFAILGDTPENALELAWFLQRYPMRVTAAAHMKAQAAAQMALGAQVEKILTGTFAPRNFGLAIPPREYQVQAAELALRTRRLLLGDDVGLGKTASAICMLADPSTRPALVVTLTHLPAQWRKELQRFLPGATSHIVKSGKPYSFGPTPDVLLISYSKLAGWADHLTGRVRSVIFDEVQELRRSKSEKYAAAKQIADRASMRVGLSATPVFNYGGEMFSILDVLAPGALGSWGEFLREWVGAVEEEGNPMSGKDREKVPIRNPRAFGTYLREQGLMLRRTRQDVARELPALTTVPHTIDSDTAAIDKVAGQAAELARIVLAQGGQARGEKLRASEELTTKLRQATGIAKAPFVAEFVRLLVESGEQVLLYGWHHAVYEIWREKLKDLAPVFFTGEDSIAKKQTAKDEFVSGRAKVLCMSLRAGAGIDGLQGACRTVVFGELDWSPGVHEQATGRIYRDGQKHPVVAYYLIADEGSDPVVSDVLGVKRAQSDGLRDPNAALIGDSQSDPGRVKKLAEEFLRQRGARRAA